MIRAVVLALVCAAPANATTADAQGSAQKIFQRAMQLRAAKKYKQAADVLEIAVKADPGYADAYSLLGEVLFDAGPKYAAESVVALQRAIQLEPNRGLHHARLCRVFRELGQKERADQACARGVAADPGNPMVHRETGRTWHQRGDLKKAADAFHLAVTADPGDARSHLELGLVYWDLGETTLARASLQTASKLDPNGRSGKEAAAFLKNPKKSKPVARSGSRPLATKRRKYDQEMAKAQAFYEKGDLDKAIRHFERALGHFDLEPKAHVSLAGVHMLKKEFKPAEDGFQRALKLMAKKDPLRGYVMSRLGDLALVGGRLAEAEIRYKGAVEETPGDVNAWLGLGKIFEKQERWDEAAVAYRRVLELRPKDQAAMQGLRRADNGGEEYPKIVAEMKDRKVLEIDATEYKPADRKLLEAMRRAEQLGAIDYLKGKTVSYRDAVVQRVGEDGNVRLYLTVKGFTEFRFARSQDAVRWFQEQGVPVKYIFYLTDGENEKVFTDQGILTDLGDRVYETSKRTGRKVWYMPGEQLPSDAPALMASASAPAEDPRVAALNNAGFDEVTEAELTMMIRQSKTDANTMLSNGTLKGFFDQERKKNRYFYLTKDPFYQLVLRFRDGDANPTLPSGAGGGAPDP